MLCLGSFSGPDGSVLYGPIGAEKIIFRPTAKKNQQKEVQSHYDIGSDFY